MSELRSSIKSQWLNISLWKRLNWTQAHISQPGQACGERRGLTNSDFCCFTGTLSVALNWPATTCTGKVFAYDQYRLVKNFFLLLKSICTVSRSPLQVCCSRASSSSAFVWLMHPPFVCLSVWPPLGNSHCCSWGCTAREETKAGDADSNQSPAGSDAGRGTNTNQKIIQVENWHQLAKRHRAEAGRAWGLLWSNNCQQGTY